jgi:hypothetical protein
MEISSITQLRAKYHSLAFDAVQLIFGLRSGSAKADSRRKNPESTQNDISAPIRQQELATTALELGERAWAGAFAGAYVMQHLEQAGGD